MMAHFKVEVVIEADRSEEGMGMFLEGILYPHFGGRITELSVYEINFTGAPM